MLLVELASVASAMSDKPPGMLTVCASAFASSLLCDLAARCGDRMPPVGLALASRLGAPLNQEHSSRSAPNQPSSTLPEAPANLFAGFCHMLLHTRLLMI